MEPIGLEESLQALERKLIVNALIRNKFGITRSARFLKITVRRLRYRCSVLKISAAEEREKQLQDAREIKLARERWNKYGPY